MSRWLSFLLAYIGATAIYYAFLRQRPFPDVYDFFYTFLGRQVAIMTDPVFWLTVLLIYGALGSQIVESLFKKNSTDNEKRA